MIRNRQQRDDAALCFQEAPAEPDTGSGRTSGRESSGPVSPALARSPKPLKSQPLVLGKRMSRTASEAPPGSLPGRRLATRAELFDPSRGYFDSAAIVVQPPETPELAEALDHALATWGATSI